MSLFSELKRRNIFKVAMAYLALGWVVVQITDIVVPALNLPESLNSIVVYIGIIGFPFALFFTWAFELTPDGVRPTSEVEEGESIRATTGQKINYIIIGLMAIAISFLLFDRNSAPDFVERENTIAVMPFADMSPDGSQEYFGDGMAEEILNVLVSVDELDVTSRTSAFSLKKEDLSIPEIAARLNVNYIVEGSIRRDANYVRVTAQLIDVAADTHLWSETYDRELTSIFAIQDEISLAIAEALKVELVGDMIGDIPTENMEAYTLYLQGHQLYETQGYDNIIKAIEILKISTELDPTYAKPWAELAVAYNSIILSIVFTDEFSPEQLMNYRNSAKFAANEAVVSDPLDGAAWSALANLKLEEYQLEDAKRASLASIALAPKNAVVWRFRGHYLRILGHNEEAIKAYYKAIELDTDLPTPYRLLAFSQLMKGDVTSAKANYEKALLLGDIGANQAAITAALLNGDRTGAQKSLSIVLNLLGDFSDENVKLFIDAYFDEALRVEARQVLRSDTRELSGIYFFPSIVILDGQGFVQYLNSLPDSSFLFSYLYMAPFRPMLNQQPVKDYIKEKGLLDYWRDNGFPFFCRAVGEDDFECQDGEGNWPD